MRYVYLLAYMMIGNGAVLAMDDAGEPSAFHKAAREGCLSDIVELIYTGQNHVDEQWILSFEPPQSVTALWLATAYCHKEVVEKLLHFDANKNILGPSKVHPFKSLPLRQAAINLERARRGLPCPRFCIGGGEERKIKWEDAEAIFHTLGGKEACTGLSVREFARPDEMDALTQELLDQDKHE